MKQFNTVKVEPKLPSIKGKMIFIDGPDGCGKSTQIKVIAEYLRNKGYDVMELRQPGMPGEHGDNMRKMLFGKDRYNNFWAVRLLFAAEYIEFMDRYGYEEDKVILCDRNPITSNLCVGGAEYGDMGDLIDNICPIYHLADRKPDNIIILNSSPSTARQRLQRRFQDGGEINHYDTASAAFHRRACEYYSKMEDIEEVDAAVLGLHSYHKTIYSIDANKSKEDVSKQVIELLNTLYEI